MKLKVLGASGKTGKWVVKLAHERGYDITAVVRPTSNYTPPEGVKIIRGEVTDSSFIEKLIEPECTIISCIGIKRNGLSPWAKILSPPDLVESVIRNIIFSTPKSSNTTLIWMSAGGVGNSKNLSTKLIKKMISFGNIRVAYNDLENAEELVRNSGLKFHTVRPVTLIHGEPKNAVSKTKKYGLFSTIRRSEVALWLIEAGENFNNELALDKEVLIES